MSEIYDETIIEVYRIIKTNASQFNPFLQIYLFLAGIQQCK